MQKDSFSLRLLAILALACAMVQAGGVSIGIGLGVPVYNHPHPYCYPYPYRVYVGPSPYYYPPPPSYYYPPPPAYYQPAPVYAQGDSRPPYMHNPVRFIRSRRRSLNRVSGRSRHIKLRPHRRIRQCSPRISSPPGSHTRPRRPLRILPLSRQTPIYN